ncbi:MAG: AI-2E family transporter [Bacilli bacterium]
MKRKDKEIDKEGLNEIIHLSQKLLRVFYVCLIIAIFLGIILAIKELKIYSIFIGVLKVISPLFIGFILTWLFHPLYKKMVDKGLNKALSAIIIFIGLVGFIFLFLYIFVPVLYKQINDLISYIPSVFSSVSNFISNTLDKFDISGLNITQLKEGIISTGQKMLSSITTGLPNSLINVVKSLVSALGTIGLSLVIMIYMLMDYDNIIFNFQKFLRKKDKKDYIKLIDNIGLNARKVVNGTLLVAFMVFVCDTIGFALVGLNSAVLFGLFCGITDLIPYIGPYIGGAAAVIVGFTQGPLVGIATLIVAIIVQLIENYVLQPVVMSKAMQLNPIAIIVGLLLFGHFFGIVGMIFATPCISIIKEIIIFISHRIKKVEE